MKLTNDIIESYFDCKLKSYLKRQGSTGEKSQMENHQNIKLHEYRAKVFYKKFAASLPVHPTQIKTCSSLENVDTAYNVQVISRNFELFCDAVKRTRIKGKLTIVPVLVLPVEKIAQKHKILVSIIAGELTHLLKVSIEFGEVIYSSKMITTKIRVSRYHKLSKATLLALEDQSPPFFCLNTHCGICEFQTTCRSKAIASDHLSLLRGIGAEKIKKLNRKGIFTINQLSYTFRPKRKSVKVDNRTKFRSFELQSLAIRENKIFIYDLPDRFPEVETELFLDIEGLPEFNFYYLIGVTIRTKQCLTHQYFWCNSKDEELTNVIEFVLMISKFKNYCVYHYGNYEIEFLKAIQKKLAEPYKVVVNSMLERCLNLLS